MNRCAMSMTRRLTAARALSACLLLAACGAEWSAPDLAQAPLAGAAIGGDFELVDSAGKPVRWADFAGQYRMVYFGYAYCPDICPLDVQRMMQGFNLFKAAHPQLAAQTRPIFISIDPRRDTPAVVGEFTGAFSDDLLGLTGTPEQVDQAAKAFAVYYKQGEVAANGGYLMDHSRGAYLMGRKGEPIALLPVDATDKGEGVAEVLEEWIS
jgi:protein SCO1